MGKELIPADEFTSETVARAKEGDAEALDEILGTFATAVDFRSQHTWQGPVPWVYARFIADAFRDILSGTDPAKAFGIAPAVGRPKTSGAKHDLDALAAAYAFLVLHRLSPKQAKSHLKEQIGAAATTIERAFNAEGAQHLRLCLNVAQGTEVAPGLDACAAVEVIKIAAQPYEPILKKILPDA